MSFAKIKPVPQESAMNAVIYARYSSEKQTENSIDGQLRACHQFASLHGYTVIGEYIDRAMSGTNDNRPQFQSMISDSERQKFAFIIVYRFDRFARNRYDSVTYKKELSKHGVRVISTAEHVGDGDEGIILESIYEAMDEAYSRRLSRITQRGMRETALKGLWTGGNVPLGYKVENQRLVVDEREASTVRYIFERYADGDTKTQICKALAERGLTTKKGKRFTCDNLTIILTNRVYIGDYHFQDIERSCPPIVSNELFEKAQAQANATRKVRGRKTAGAVFELTGKLYCGHCKTAMVGDSGTGRNGDTHYYYTCNERKKRRGCQKKSEKKDFIEWYVCEQTVQNVLTDENIEKISKNVAAAAEQDLHNGEIVALEKRIVDINRELDACADALIKSSSDAVVRRINEKSALLEKQLADAEHELSKMRVPSGYEITVDMVQDFLRDFAHGDLSDQYFRHHLIHSLINRVYLYDDKVLIYYNVCNLSQVSVIDLQADLDTLANECSDCTGQGEPKRKSRHRRDFLFGCSCLIQVSDNRLYNKWAL